uniref:Uncharacterized protein n=1 Tax=Arundo donax TaxID=35708 RepID=A0A0A9HJQ0_ARUDO
MLLLSLPLLPPWLVAGAGGAA